MDLIRKLVKRKATVEELEAPAESNGYKREAHRERDSTLDNGQHNKKTKRNQLQYLWMYLDKSLPMDPRTTVFLSTKSFPGSKTP